MNIRRRRIQSLAIVAIALVLCACAGQVYVEWISFRPGIAAGTQGIWRVVDGPPGKGSSVKTDRGMMERPPGKELSFFIIRANRSHDLIDCVSVFLLVAGVFVSSVAVFLSRPRIIPATAMALALVFLFTVPLLSQRRNLLSRLLASSRTTSTVPQENDEASKKVEEALSLANAYVLSPFELEDVLRKIGPDAALPLCRHVMLPDTATSRFAVIGIIRIGPENGGGGAALLSAIATQPAKIRETIAIDLGNPASQCKHSVVALLGLLEDPTPLVRGASIASLTDYGEQEKSVIPVLIGAFDDPEPVV